MIIVDKALEARAEQGKPIKVAILGGGFMAQGLTNQIVNSVPAMRMVAIYSRKPQKAMHVLNYSGLENPIEAITQTQLDDAIRDGKPVFTQDVMLLARSEHVDLIVDTTGSVEFGAHVCTRGIQTRQRRCAAQCRTRCDNRPDSPDLR